MVTIKDIAKESGVAKSTVSNVFSGNKFVSPAIRARVLDVSKKLDYKPNFYASALSNKKESKILGLFLENNEADGGFQPYYGTLIDSLIVEAAKKGFSLLTYYGLSNDEMASRLVQGRSPIDAAVVVSPSIGDARLAQIDSSLIPFVVIGNPRVESGNKMTYIDTDNQGLVEKVTLLMAKKKVHRVLLINANSRLTISQDRDEGFKKGLKEAGIDGDICYSVHSTKEDGYYFAAQAIKKNCDAIICANGYIASGAYEAIADAGKKVGKEIVVFSLGYSYNADLHFDPSLSYATQDYPEFSRKAVEVLLARMTGAKARGAIIIDSMIHFHESLSQD